MTNLEKPALKVDLADLVEQEWILMTSFPTLEIFSAIWDLAGSVAVFISNHKRVNFKGATCG